MNEALLAQRRPCLNKGDYRLVTNQEQNCSTGREGFRWGRTGRAPRPAADGTLEQAEIMLEMTSDAAVAHDAERSCVDCSVPVAWIRSSHENREAEYEGRRSSESTPRQS